jgi:DUF1680 family protein
MISRKMYITGRAGATAKDEAFGKDYFLPNDGYIETCGAVGAGFFDYNMNLRTGETRYIDEQEYELYNGALTGVSLAGTSYTYVYPLHTRNGNSRWAWHSGPCGPHMLSKFLGAMPGYIYTYNNNGISINFFVSSNDEIQLPGNKVTLEQTTGYPWKGNVKVVVTPAKAGEFDLNFRTSSCVPSYYTFR